MRPITNPLFIDFSSEDFCNGRFRCSAFREPEKYTKFTERFVHFECSIFPQEELLETDEERRKEELISLFSLFITSKEDCLKLREIFLSLFAYNKDVWFHFILRIYSENDKSVVEEWAKELNSLERTKGYVKLLGTYKK